MALCLESRDDTISIAFLLSEHKLVKAKNQEFTCILHKKTYAIISNKEMTNAKL